MLKSLYIQNFRCFQNFTLNMTNKNFALLVGKNGGGKSTIFDVLKIFNNIGNGETELDDMISIDDFAFENTNQPIELKIIADIDDTEFEYEILIDLLVLENISRCRIKREILKIENDEIIKREYGEVNKDNAKFNIDWHRVALPIILADRPNNRTDKNIRQFKNWLSDLLIISPIPANFNDFGDDFETQLYKDCSNLISYIRKLYRDSPEFYNILKTNLTDFIPDFKEISFAGRYDSIATIHFENEKESLKLKFSKLSSGEKIYFLIALVNSIAQYSKFSNILIGWDEPNNYISTKELSKITFKFRNSFSNSNSQLIISSHNERVMNSFYTEDIFWLSRNTHLSPITIKEIGDYTDLPEEYDMDITDGK
ncbi:MULTISPECIES: AAA family ATPase [unclassified Campylobacter]|uniref:AAA family ATPase n=1 Tax=unclassified Campylobacter TaxID=2593542 RepID=UPI0022EA0208|nr:MULTISPECIES: AAA family ATPase [unclassified Campylobacter]MDA3079905.1 ATP-binding protein [Campylobacter sp. CS_NA2]MDA3081335.1 ATP-binding protein [Campylobacter sp. CS_NA1]MDA3086006.1 ATP-binding protein [Campylobacter sp. CS_ED1]MDA3090739.1 ATP-binding protein [Campylobacter sp. CS_ED2]WBR51974.1 AAA family ATPase [Campylobacter sp. CS_NA3]